MTFVIIALCVHGLTQTNATPARLLGGLSNLGSFLIQAFPPDLTRLPQLGLAMLLTLEMALLGVGLGIVLSVPFCLLTARNTNPNFLTRTLAQGLVTLFRTIPDLIWALIFVVSVGLGPLAGILAIAMDTIGFCARFFAERVEETPAGPVDAVRTTGAPRLDVIGAAIIPETLPALTATSLYALEKAVRSAVVLGLVGAGGIGVELSAAMDLYRYDQALTVILLILIVVVAVEQLSATIRRRFI